MTITLAILILPPQPAPNPGPSHRIDLWARDSYTLTCETNFKPFDVVRVEGPSVRLGNNIESTMFLELNQPAQAISTNLALGTTGKCGMAELKAGEWYTVTIHFGDRLERKK